MSNGKKLNLEIDTSKMSPSQIRLIRTINTTISQVAITEDESEFFELSAELMKQLASMIQQANFHDRLSTADINYADQAVEFSIDSVNEALLGKKIISYDN